MRPFAEERDGTTSSKMQPPGVEEMTTKKGRLEVSWVFRGYRQRK